MNDEQTLVFSSRRFGLVIAFTLGIGLHFAGSAVFAEEDPRGKAKPHDYAALKNDSLEVLIGNNKSLTHPGGEHRAGYNGIFFLRNSAEKDSPFVPSYAGLNLEHYFDGRGDYEEREVFFEPRFSAMSLQRIDEQTVELHQPATPTFGVESWTRFRLHDSGSRIDFSFRCIPRKGGFAGDFFGVFWASYINGPIDKSMYFLDGQSTRKKPFWKQLCTQEHNRDSTVRSQNDSLELIFQETGNTLFTAISPLRYSEPVFYGRFRNMVLIYLFQPDSMIRFTHSPSGGGRNPAGDDSNPAWDFQYIVPSPKIGKEYGLKGRLVFKEWKGRDDVLKELSLFAAGG